MPKVSIIIPVYNTEKYLRKCLDSVLNQTLSDLEIICIDDCSTDGSLTVLKEYAALDSRIKIIEFKENKGVSAARNTGIEAATGEYIGFVDPDDYIDFDFYEKLYNKANECKADIIKANLIKHKNGECEISGVNNSIKKSQSKMGFYSNFFSGIYKTSFVKENVLSFNINYTNGEDTLFLQKAIIAADSFNMINDTFYHYVRRFDGADSDILENNKVSSILNVRKEINSILNNSYLNNKLTKNDYKIAYLINYKRIFYCLFKNDTLELKKACAEAFVEDYKNCLEKDYILENFPQKYLLDFITAGKADVLTEELTKVKTNSDFETRKRIFELRKKAILCR